MMERHVLSSVVALGAAIGAGIVMFAAEPAAAQPAAGGNRDAPPAETRRPFAPEADPDSALVRALKEITGDRLTLQEALRSALDRNPALRAAEAGVRAAEGARMAEAGAFDPELFAEAVRTDEDRPSASAFVGSDETTTAGAGARWRSPIGTEITASLTATRLESNSAFATLSPQYDASGRIDLTQPLLKGFGPATSAALAAARREVESAEASRDDARLATLAGVEGAYWALYAAERNLAVQRLVRDQADAFLEEARVRERAGLVGPNQVATARVFLAEQEQAVLDRENELDATSDALASLIGRRPAGGETRFRPADEPPRAFPVAPIEELVARAEGANPALRALERRVAGLQARARGATWDALPAVDLVASVGGLGLSGTGRDTPFTDSTWIGRAGVWSDAIEDALARRYPTWSAGVRVSVPLPLREGRGERDRLRAEVARAEEDLEALRRALDEQVRAVWRELSQSSRRLDLAREGVDASFEQVRIGVLEYRAGRTSAFELVRLGADLATAQQRYSQALVRMARATAEMRRLTGEGLAAAENRS